MSASSTAHTSSSFFDSAHADADGAYGGVYVSAVAVAVATVAVEIAVPVQEGARVPVAALAREGERVRGLCVWVCDY